MRKKLFSTGPNDENVFWVAPSHDEALHGPYFAIVGVVVGSLVVEERFCVFGCVENLGLVLCLGYCFGP